MPDNYKYAQPGAGSDFAAKDISGVLHQKLILCNTDGTALDGESNVPVMKTGNLVTSATTADQVVLTYTVTTGKTLYLTHVAVQARLTTYAATATDFGYWSLENPAATKLSTSMLAHAGDTQHSVVTFATPLRVADGTVVQVVCTPSAATSFTWQANFGGYEI